MRGSLEPLGDHATVTSHSRPTRVPDPSPIFWVAKAVSTALGEAVSDFSIRALDPVVAVLLKWMWLISIAMLIGAELNSQLEGLRDALRTNV